jgi:DNA-binding CsgD family transcriptional regulator
MVRADGSVRELHAIGRIDHDEAGSARWLGSVQDVTDHRLSARELRAHDSASRATREGERPHPLFLRSLNPMMIVDDERRYVDANAAACLFLRLSHEEICKLRIDDITQPKLRRGLDARWEAFLQRRFSAESAHGLRWDFHLPDGTSVAVDLCSVPDFQPGRHLGIVLFPLAEALNERVGLARPPDSRVLSKREREVLTLVALGNTGVQIAAQLFLSPATVQTHVANILIKLRAKNRAHGIAIAMQTGELDLEDGLHEPRLLDSRTSLPKRPPEWP